MSTASWALSQARLWRLESPVVASEGCCSHAEPHHCPGTMCALSGAVERLLRMCWGAAVPAVPAGAACPAVPAVVTAAQGPWELGSKAVAGTALQQPDRCDVRVRCQATSPNMLHEV